MRRRIVRGWEEKGEEKGGGQDEGEEEVKEEKKRCRRCRIEGKEEKPGE